MLQSLNIEYIEQKISKRLSELCDYNDNSYIEVHGIDNNKTRVPGITADSSQQQTTATVYIYILTWYTPLSYETTSVEGVCLDMVVSWLSLFFDARDLSRTMLTSRGLTTPNTCTATRDR